MALFSCCIVKCNAGTGRVKRSSLHYIPLHDSRSPLESAKSDSRQTTWPIDEEGDTNIVKIALLGGTGNEGRGLGLRWALSGYDVFIGSRSAERGAQAAQEMNEFLPGHAAQVAGGDNAAMAQQGDVVVLSVPYKAQQATLEAVRGVLDGKLLISVVVPIQPPKVSHVWHPAAGSAAQEAQEYLGDAARVVAAFQNISAELLPDPEHAVDCDVLICGESREDKAVAIELSRAAGLRGLDAGPLRNAGVVEGMSAVLIGINLRHKVKHSGIRITGIGSRD